MRFLGVSIKTDPPLSRRERAVFRVLILVLWACVLLGVAGVAGGLLAGG